MTLLLVMNLGFAWGGAAAPATPLEPMTATASSRRFGYEALPRSFSPNASKRSFTYKTRAE